MNTGIKSESNYRTRQRFFKIYEMNYDDYSRFVLMLLSRQSK
ncbi:MAG TPA: hypothetical protein PKA90_01240 [Ignavibacteria bacterium]|nr:hypothetical protein [Ignavibacteria bacterium]HMR39029.1 hypothetical protein [Ignavibacteria bacterium]